MRIVVALCILTAFLYSCKSDNSSSTEKQQPEGTAQTKQSGKYFAGALSNGMKGDSIFFDISSDGKKLQNLTFKGYWRCSGKLEQTITGPEGSFDIVDGKVSGHTSEPPNGGSTAWRFDLDANINGDKSEGTFRMNINNLGCDTYKLNFTATAK